MAGSFTGRVGVQSGIGQAGLLAVDYQYLANKQTSVANTTNVLVIEIRNLQNILGIHMVASAGTATLLVEASVDNSTWLQIDSIAAALVTDLQYTIANNVLNGAVQAATAAGTGASTVKLNPLAFRYIRVTGGAAGIGNTTTITIVAK